MPGLVHCVHGAGNRCADGKTHGSDTPLVMLLLDIYPLKRITISEGTSQNLRVLLEKVPLFLLISILSIFTILAQHAGGAFESFERMPLHFRLVNALYSPLFYLAKMLWPIGLVPFYPFSQAIGFFDPTYGISGILALSITGGCVWLWKRGRILFLIVWAYYLITLLPVVGIVQVGIQAAADRYTYLPSVSIFLVAGIAVAQLFAVLVRSKNIIITGGVIVVLIFILFGLLTVKQIKIWQDSERFGNISSRVFLEECISRTTTWAYCIARGDCTIKPLKNMKKH